MAGDNARKPWEDFTGPGWTETPLEHEPFTPAQERAVAELCRRANYWGYREGYDTASDWLDDHE